MLTLICLIFVLLGAINWFLVGAINFDIFAKIFGSSAAIGARVFYIMIGMMSLWLLYVLIFRRDVISIKNDFHFSRESRIAAQSEIKQSKHHKSDKSSKRKRK